MNTIEIIKNVITEQLQITGLADIEVATIESLQPISIKSVSYTHLTLPTIA